MEDYLIKKVLNNNVVVAKRNQEDVILVGKAIGFNRSKGDVVSEEQIEGIYIRQASQNKSDFEKVLQIIDSNIVGLSEEIISLCEKELKLKLNESIHVSLPDHINFTLRRIKKGIAIENPFLYELNALYPKEYNLAKQAINMIKERFQIELPEDEIGFICLHIRAAVNQQDVSKSLEYTRKIGEVMEFISKLLNIKFDKNSLQYVRTITHINFMLDRVLNYKPIKNYLLDSIKVELYSEYDNAIKVAIKIDSIFSVKIPEDEIGYIALHLKRLTEI